MIKNTNIIRNKMLSYEDIQERLDVLKDSYKGEKCYIVGAGPSLKNYDVDYVKDKLKDYYDVGKRNGKTPVEASEDIEIIRFLEMGVKVKMVEVEGGTLAVDFLEDVKEVEKIFRKQQLYSKLDDKVKTGIR